MSSTATATPTAETPAVDEAAAAAAVRVVQRRATAARTARGALNDAIRDAHAAGARDIDIVRASGLAKDTVRRVLGKIEVKDADRTRP